MPYDGDEIALMAGINENKSGAPVVDASIQVNLGWQGPVPGSPGQAPETAPPVQMWESESAAGRYAGTVMARQAEGYYTLRR